LLSVKLTLASLASHAAAELIQLGVRKSESGKSKGKKTEGSAIVIVAIAAIIIVLILLFILIRKRNRKKIAREGEEDNREGTNS